MRGEELNQEQLNNIIENIERQGVPRVQHSLRKKHVRRCAKELVRQFKCLYNCGKEFATDAARNMHMRKKHNEVTKTERDRKAREIINMCNLKNNQETLRKLSNLTYI
jgi:hypothetical protein